MERGGDVTPGRAYVVGEKRPELFVPSAAGRIYPSVPSGSGGGDTNYNLHFAPQIDAMDGVSVDRVLREHSRVFQKHVEDSIRKANA